MKLFFFYFLCIMTISVYAQEKHLSFVITDWLKAGNMQVVLPAFYNIENINGDTFGKVDLLKFEYVDIKKLYPSKDDDLKWLNQTTFNWKQTKTNASDNYLYPNSAQESTIDQLCYLVAYLETDRFCSVKLKCTSPQMFELFIDGEKKITKYSIENDESQIKEKICTSNIETGKHIIVIKTYYDGSEIIPWKLKTEIEPTEKTTKSNIKLSVNSFRNYMLEDIIETTVVSSIKIAGDGKNAAIFYQETKPDGSKSNSWFDIYNTDNKQIIFTSKNSNYSNMQWDPVKNAFTYKINNQIWYFDISSNRNELLLDETKNLVDYSWSPDGSFIIYSLRENAETNKTGLKKLEGMADRQPWWRNRTFLYKLDINSGISQKLTHGNYSILLQDISYDGKKMIFTQSIPDYNNIPYSKQIVFLMDLNTCQADTLWISNYSSTVYFLNKNELLIIAGASIFNGAGLNLDKGKVSNNYDKQAYIYNIASGKIQALSKNFDPSWGF